MVDLRGKWVLITGASRGIGRLSAIYMAKQGCNVILHSRKIEGTKELKQELEETYGVKTYAVACELSELRAVDELLNEIDAQGIQVDVILNNAGLQIAYRNEFIDTPMEDYRISFLVNTMAPMKICYHFLPGMIERGFGRIVNTTSGIDLEAEQAGYSASKAALDKVTRDLGYKINGTDVIISLTDPGWCQTDLGGSQAPNTPESALPGVLVGAFVDDKKSGRIFRAQEFAGMSLEEAVKKAESIPGEFA